MPAAVLDLNLENLPSQIDNLKGYDRALCLLRFRAKPVGQKILPVQNEQIIIKEFYHELVEAAGYRLPTHWLHQYLDWNNRKVKGFKPPKATIAICTRDREQDLKRCLNALIKLPDDGQEVLVIDNCPSTNETQQLVETYPGVRYICEPRPGLNIARNRALQEAKHEIVAFTDDDAVPDTTWLRALVSNFDNPLVLCVTGLTMPLELETEAQEAFEKYSPFNKGFTKKLYSSNTCNPLATGNVGAGANMALRKTVQQSVGFFDEALDAGTPTQSGGDHEFFARILIGGFSIVYEPEALSWHRHRRTWKETRKAVEGYGTGVYAFWTRTLFVEREFSILKFPWDWFRHEQLPNLVRAIIRRPNAQPLSLVLAELKGCYVGPWAYFLSKRRLRKKR